MHETLKHPVKYTDARININNDADILFWAKQLNTTPNKLREAVASIGTMATYVKIWLKNNRE